MNLPTGTRRTDIAHVFYYHKAPHKPRRISANYVNLSACTRKSALFITLKDRCSEALMIPNTISSASLKGWGECAPFIHTFYCPLSIIKYSATINEKWCSHRLEVAPFQQFYRRIIRVPPLAHLWISNRFTITNFYKKNEKKFEKMWKLLKIDTSLMVAGLINPIPLIAEWLEMSALSRFHMISRTFAMRSLEKIRGTFYSHCNAIRVKTSGWRTFGRATKDEERKARSKNW